MEQSEQVFVVLKRNGVRVELVRYPDESHNHAVGGQPRHRTDRLERILAWLHRYVGLGPGVEQPIAAGERVAAG